MMRKQDTACFAMLSSVVFVATAFSGAQDLQRMGLDHRVLAAGGLGSAALPTLVGFAALPEEVVQMRTDLTTLAAQYKSLQTQVTTDGQSDDLQGQLSTLSVEGGAGAWVGHVSRRANSRQGWLIRDFYDKYGINPGDRFRVETNHRCY